MDLLQVIVLAIVQGITEFLPVSSSAHLILVPQLTKWEDQGLAFDVALHLGTLIAVMVYFRNDMMRMAKAWLSGPLNVAKTDIKLGWFVILGTIPAVIVGGLSSDLIELYLRHPLVIASTTIMFGLLLGLAQRFNHGGSIEQLNWKQTLLIGAFQALALIPGTSRSGITLTAALLVGLSPSQAARFSFWLAIPLILAASVLQLFKLSASDITIDWMGLGLGLALSALSALLCIHWFLAFIDRVGVQPFVWYRVLLGGVLFWLFL